MRPNEVSKWIDKLDLNRSSGIGGLGVKILKCSYDSVTPVISHVIDKSIEHVTLQDALKDAFGSSNKFIWRWR